MYTHMLFLNLLVHVLYRLYCFSAFFPFFSVYLGQPIHSRAPTPPLKHLIPVPTFLKHSPSLEKGSLNFILRDEDFIMQQREGKHLISGSKVRKHVADSQISLWLAELFLTCQLISSMAAYCIENEILTPYKASRHWPLLTFLVSSLATLFSKYVPKPAPSIMGFEKEVKKNVFSS